MSRRYIAFNIYTYTNKISLIFCITLVRAVTNVNTSSRDLEQFRYCMHHSQHPSLRECVGRTAINFLQRVDEHDNYTLFNDLVSKKDDKIAGRSLVNFLDTDPVDFRGILENAGAVMGQRGLEFHMDAIYPGLMFKIGPTIDTNSVAQFALDPATLERNFGYEEPSTARILAKQYLLPFLLGFKFNLVALVPLVFAAICLLLKKSLFLAKFAIYLSSFLGVGGALTALSAGYGGFGGGFGLFGGGGGGALGGIPLGAPAFHAHAHASDGGDGYLPGKAGALNQYSSDELYHNAPYKRHDRKVHFEKPREYVTRATVTTTTTAPDRFYEYEKQVAIMHNRSGKPRSTNGQLGPSAYDDNGEVINGEFKTTTQERNGWKVVDLRN